MCEKKLEKVPNCSVGYRVIFLSESTVIWGKDLWVPTINILGY